MKNQSDVVPLTRDDDCFVSLTPHLGFPWPSSSESSSGWIPFSAVSDHKAKLAYPPWNTPSELSSQLNPHRIVPKLISEHTTVVSQVWFEREYQVWTRNPQLWIPVMNACYAWNAWVDANAMFGYFQGIYLLWFKFYTKKSQGIDGMLKSKSQS